MKFGNREQRAATRDRPAIDFDHFEWKNREFIRTGWHPGIVLYGEEKPSNKTAGKPAAQQVMVWHLTVGLQLPNGVGARIVHYVAENYPPKVDEMMDVLFPELADEAGAFELDVKKAIGKRAAFLVGEQDQCDQHGNPFLEVAKLEPLDVAIAREGESFKARSFAGILVGEAARKAREEYKRKRAEEEAAEQQGREAEDDHAGPGPAPAANDPYDQPDGPGSAPDDWGGADLPF